MQTFLLPQGKQDAASAHLPVRSGPLSYKGPSNAPAWAAAARPFLEVSTNPTPRCISEPMQPSVWEKKKQTPQYLVP